MCLVTDNKEVKVAKKDIKVYKVVAKGSKSIIQSFDYTKGKLNITEFTFLANDHSSKTMFSNGWAVFTQEAVDYLNKNHPDWFETNGESRKDLICVAQGFHSFLKFKDAKEQLKRRRTCTVVRFIIPAGSEYYTDNTGEIVSNQITML